MHKQYPIMLFSISIALFITICASLYFNHYHWILIFLWLGSLSCFILSVYGKKLAFKLPAFFNLQSVLVGLVILLPVFVRLVSMDQMRIHRDEFLTGYFSDHIKLTQTNFFGPIPENPDDWVAQFPSLYFFLQKIFFLVGGVTPLTVKLSTIPYVLIVSVLLYLVARSVLPRPLALISVIFYAFSPVSIYLETFGLPFISSTAVFLLLCFLLVRYIKKPGAALAGLIGVSSGLNYLFYTSSYLAIPLVGIVGAIYAFTHIPRWKKLFFHASYMIVGIAIVLVPFIIPMEKNGYYLFDRYDQVKLLSGEWSPYKEKIANHQITSMQALQENMELGIKSLHTDDVGGHGGYDFGHLAFFDRFSLYVLILGIALSMFLSIRKRAYTWAITILIIVGSFITAIVLTIPPPAYHRFSLAFPFIALIMASPLALLKFDRKNYVFGLFFIVPLVILVSFSGYQHFQKAIEKENLYLRDDLKDVVLIKYLQEKHPGKPVSIAAFPSFAFETIFYFFDIDRVVTTDYHGNFMKSFNADKPYLYVILFPDEFVPQFTALDPEGTMDMVVPGKYAVFYK